MVSLVGSTISIHAPAKGATKLATAMRQLMAISIHAPAKGATVHSFQVLPGLTISIHAPAKGATYMFVHAPCRNEYFNPRSREGSDNCVPRYSLYPENFNPRSREGSDKCAISAVLYSLISIHAPAKGATSNSEMQQLSFYISIHAPAKGATDTGLLNNTAPLPFQSTLPRRERHFERGEINIYGDFNPRSREGSDLVQNGFKPMFRYFNPRSREGSDKCVIVDMCTEYQFQSTLPRRERLD